MSDRLLRESIKYSRRIDSLSCFQETAFYRLLVTVDDFGKSYANPQLLKCDLFPMKEDLTKSSMAECLEKLEKVGLIKQYEVDGEKYLKIVNWSKYNRPRALKSRFPDEIPKSKQTELKDTE